MNSDLSVNSEWQSHQASSWKVLANITSVYNNKNLLNWLGNPSSYQDLKLFPSLFSSASKSRHISYALSFFVLYKVTPLVVLEGLTNVFRGHLARTLSETLLSWSPFPKASLPALCVFSQVTVHRLSLWDSTGLAHTLKPLDSSAALVLPHFCH